MDGTALPRAQPESEPVFLVGCHRAGTTLARYLLDAHPRLACPPESKFVAGLEAFLRYPQAMNGLSSLGWPQDRVEHSIRALIEEVLGGYTLAQGKRRWIDKTPNYWRLLPFLDRIFNRQVRYLLMVRHPLDSVHSLEELFVLNTPEDRRIDDPDIARVLDRHGRDRPAWAKYWVEVNEALHGFSLAQPSRSLVFRYEDLVRDPAATMMGIMTFLGEEMPADLVHRAFLTRPTRGYQDPKILKSRAISSESVGRWRGWPPEEIRSIWSIVGTTAAKFDYPAPAATRNPEASTS